MNNFNLFIIVIIIALIFILFCVDDNSIPNNGIVSPENNETNKKILSDKNEILNHKSDIMPKIQSNNDIDKVIGYSSNLYQPNVNANTCNLGINPNDPKLRKFMEPDLTKKPEINNIELQPKEIRNDWFSDIALDITLDDANLLADAIMKQGVNTVGSWLKNPTYDIRGNVPNPKFIISPWNNSSIEPDLNFQSGALCS